MDIYIVDSNLIFSAIFNLNSGIGQFILKSRSYNVSLYAPRYLKLEIDKHFDKIVQRSGLSAEDIRSLLDKIYGFITFINDEIIPFEKFVEAMRLDRDIDPDDVTFVALTNFLDKTLWTGDAKLYTGLKALGYEKVVNFSDIKDIYSL